MESLVSPVLLYSGLALGAVGVAFALPRRGVNPQVLGAMLAAVGGGLAVLAVTLGSLGALPNVHFYVFSAIALGSALRVVTHPKPVYAALYFVLTILASAGLYVILSAEFMAFALIIVYAGAILITYLFVIMLATQAPTNEDEEALASYDKFAREPAIATVFGFVLVAGVVALMAGGVTRMEPATEYAGAARLAELPGKVEKALVEAGMMTNGQRAEVDVAAGTVRVDGGEAMPMPAGLGVGNVEGVGFSLLAEHPGAIEIAGVVLLMAMVGAVVLSRKRVELDEKIREAEGAGRLGTGEGVGA